MANSQEEQGALQEAQSTSEDKNDKDPVEQGQSEAIETARSELRQTMADVVENPPAEQPQPPTLVTQEILLEEPVPDPYDKAISYLERHNILQIFQNMTANIVYNKPDNPLDFMISEIAEMKKYRESKQSASSEK